MKRAIGRLVSRFLGTTPGQSPGSEEELATRRFRRRCAALLATVEAVGAGGTASDAVVIQGPLASSTVDAVGVLRRLYPNETVVVSTWEDSAPSLLGAVGPLCDAVVLSPKPLIAGGSNRNYQIASTFAGIAKARELGATTILKMRSDTFLLAPGIFTLYRAACNSVDQNKSLERGLRGRLCVPQTYTKKYFPYHVSDIVMLGHAEDLARYWSLPLDSRPLDPDSYSWGCQALERIGMDGLLPETYLGLHYARSIDAVGDAPLEDYWRLLRDHFIVVDDAWFDFYWTKRPSYLQPRAVDEVVNHAFWLSLYNNLPICAVAWQAELADARHEGATFAYNTRPPDYARR